MQSDELGVKIAPMEIAVQILPINQVANAEANAKDLDFVAQ